MPSAWEFLRASLFCISHIRLLATLLPESWGFGDLPCTERGFLLLLSLCHMEELLLGARLDRQEMSGLKVLMHCMGSGSVHPI